MSSGIELRSSSVTVREEFVIAVVEVIGMVRATFNENGCTR